MTPSDGRDSGKRVTLDQSFRAVSHPARRRVLLALNDENPRNVAEFESVQASSGSLAGDDSRIELYHRHLPHLVDDGFVDWDRSTDTITKGPRFEEIRPLLTWIREQSEGLPGNVP